MTGSGNTTWYLPGRVPTLIDAGAGVPTHFDELVRALEGAELAQVLVTHGHVDHAGGAAFLAARMPQVRFCKVPWPGQDTRWGVTWHRIDDGQMVAAGDGHLQVVHTPGHSPDHACFWSGGDRTLFCGDLAWQGSTVVIPPAYGGDMVQYLASLDRVAALSPVRMLPAHGPVIDEPVALLREYIAHRYTRERQILSALASGPATVDALVTAVYPTVSKALRPVASESVLAHLLKLEREERVGRDQDSWHIMRP